MGFNIWPLVIIGGLGSLGVYFLFNRLGKGGEGDEFGEPDIPPPSETGPPKLSAEQYEKFGNPYGVSYDNYLITGALPIRPSDTTSIAPFSKEYIYYYPSTQLPSFLHPATFLRVQPPPLPKPQPWTYSNYMDQM
jgi:hypothetical protein